MLTSLDLTICSDITRISHPFAEIWIAKDEQTNIDYAYGGTRLVSYSALDEEVEEELKRLTLYESSLKNRLINFTLRAKQESLSKYSDRLPQGFLESHVGGGRCLIRPTSPRIEAILKNPHHPAFHDTLLPLFREIGEFLNEQGGRIKLTPDFGRFAGLSDMLALFTPHVLGIKCEEGGCGGKSSYSSTGVIAAMEVLVHHRFKDFPLTLIGSAGAMGCGVLDYFLREGFSNIAICDLVYEKSCLNSDPANGPIQLPSQKGMFTNECLQRGGLIVATTLGHELACSNWQYVPAHTLLLLAHNLAIPEGEAGITLMRTIASRDIIAIPGQILTLGGALTSRLEWFWRQANPGRPFDKPQAHLVVRDVVTFLISLILKRAEETRLTPYEAMFDLVKGEQH